MDQTTHDIRKALWLDIITQCQNRPDGTTVTKWLAENQVKEKAYYYWLRKIRREAAENMQLPAVSKKNEITFAELPHPVVATAEPKLDTMNNAVATIRVNGITLELTNEISAPLLSQLLGVLNA